MAEWTPLEMWIRARAAERALTVTELADAVGVSRSTVHAWFDRRSAPPADKLVAMADALGLDDVARVELLAMFGGREVAP